jgi:hypothetical protein
LIVLAKNIKSAKCGLPCRYRHEKPKLRPCRTSPIAADINIRPFKRLGMMVMPAALLLALAELFLVRSL